MPTQSPLTCVMPVKTDADYDALVAVLRQVKPQVDQALDGIKTVHFARFVFFDKKQLAIITTYDGDFNKYISDFADHIGPIFDALFQHIDNPPPLPVKKNQAEFIDWVKKHDIPAAAFYSAYPNRTVIDILSK